MTKLEQIARKHCDEEHDSQYVLNGILAALRELREELAQQFMPQCDENGTSAPWGNGELIATSIRRFGEEEV